MSNINPQTLMSKGGRPQVFSTEHIRNELFKLREDRRRLVTLRQANEREQMLKTGVRIRIHPTEQEEKLKKEIHKLTSILSYRKS
jgi:hypothetical protein